MDKRAVIATILDVIVLKVWMHVVVWDFVVVRIIPSAVLWCVVQLIIQHAPMEILAIHDYLYSEIAGVKLHA